MCSRYGKYAQSRQYASYARTDEHRCYSSYNSIVFSFLYEEIQSGKIPRKSYEFFLNLRHRLKESGISYEYNDALFPVIYQEHIENGIIPEMLVRPDG